MSWGFLLDWNAALSAIPPTFVSIVTLVLVRRMHRELEPIVQTMRAQQAEQERHTLGQVHTRVTDRA